MLYSYISAFLTPSSSERLPPAEDENKYGDPQPDIMQRERELGTHISEWIVSIKSLSFRVQGSLQQKKWGCGEPEEMWLAEEQVSLNQLSNDFSEVI